MREWPLPNLKAVALNARALGLGVFVAVTLVTGYIFVEGMLAKLAAGSQLLTPVGWQVEFAALAAVVFAAFIAVICTPIWMVMAMYRLSGWPAAAALGFIATLGVWVAEEMQGHSIVEAMRSGFVWATCGAIAGLATWWARPRRPRE